jgi:hypothetical protein
MLNLRTTVLGFATSWPKVTSPIPGIGEWTAQYIVMRGLGEPDAFPVGDSGLLRASSLKSTRELEKRAEVWRPWRAYAAMYLWQVPNKLTALRTGDHDLIQVRQSFGRKEVVGIRLSDGLVLR